jgi:hypothetical protein
MMNSSTIYNQHDESGDDLFIEVEYELTGSEREGFDVEILGAKEVDSGKEFDPRKIHGMKFADHVMVSMFGMAS